MPTMRFLRVVSICLPVVFVVSCSWGSVVADCAPGSVASPDKFWVPGGSANQQIGHVPVPAKSGADGKYLLNAGLLGINEYANQTAQELRDAKGAKYAHGTVSDSTGLPTATTGGWPWPNTEPFYDNFTNGLQSKNFMILLQKKGAVDNVDVVIDKVNHVHKPVVKLTARASRTGSGYSLDSTGILQTSTLYNSGRFEITAKFPPLQGLVSSLWLFHYETHFAKEAGSDNQYVPVTGAGSDCEINHEVDWEVPASCMNSMCKNGACVGDFATANFNNYVFTNTDGTGPAFANLCVKAPRPFVDNKYHKYAIEWHSGDDTCAGRTDFFFDGEYVGTNDAFPPTRAARFTFGIWGGYTDWVGPIEWQETFAMVSDVTITPFNEGRDANYPQRMDQPNDTPFAVYADIPPPS